MTYEEFRTGLTFGEVRKMLWSSNPDPKTWRYKRRGTVLGMWRQIKQEMWREYQRREDEASLAVEPGGGSSGAWRSGPPGASPLPF